MAGRAPGLERNHMHELNIVTYVIDQVKEIAAQNELTEIDSVTLELGEVSGVVSDYLKDCWAWYAKKTPLIQNASLAFETIPAITWCNACKTTYLDANGNLIAMVVAKSGTTSSGISAEGLGFAIPVNDIIDSIKNQKVVCY